MKAQVHHVMIELTRGDITAQKDLDAVVNAANAQLRTGGGVAGAIHRKAGPELEAECRPLAPIRAGQAVITSAHNLPNRHIIHCLGPIYGEDQPSDQLLTQCYENALEIAEERQLESIAFPALSTGAFGYPMGEAAEIALSTVVRQAPSLKSVRRIRFVLFGQEALNLHEEVLRTLIESR